MNPKKLKQLQKSFRIEGKVGINRYFEFVAGVLTYFKDTHNFAFI